MVLTLLLVPFTQGLTGRPGDAGPQGKVGPAVSTILIIVTLNVIYRFTSMKFEIKIIEKLILSSL